MKITKKTVDLFEFAAMVASSRVHEEGIKPFAIAYMVDEETVATLDCRQRVVEFLELVCKYTKQSVGRVDVLIQFIDQVVSRGRLPIVVGIGKSIAVLQGDRRGGN